MIRNIAFIMLLMTGSAMAGPFYLPKIPSSKDLSKTLNPPLAGCDQCIQKPISDLKNNTERKISSMAFLAEEQSIIDTQERLKEKFQCREGSKRLSEEVVFYTLATSDGTMISKSFQAGALMVGHVSEVYVGISAFKDLMFLQKVKNGEGKLIGYNVVISACEVKNAYANYPKLVSDERELTNFVADNGIVLNTSKICGYGLIASAHNTSLISRKDPKEKYSSDIPIYTSFASPECE